MQQGEPLTMTRAEWRKSDPDKKSVEGGQHWLLVRRDGETYLCPVVIVRRAEQPRHTTRRTKT